MIPVDVIPRVSTCNGSGVSKRPRRVPEDELKKSIESPKGTIRVLPLGLNFAPEAQRSVRGCQVRVDCCIQIMKLLIKETGEYHPA